LCPGVGRRFGGRSRGGGGDGVVCACAGYGSELVWRGFEAFYSWLSDVSIGGAAYEDKGAPTSVVCGIKGDVCTPTVPENIQRRSHVAVIRYLERYPDGDHVELYRGSLPSR